MDPINEEGLLAAVEALRAEHGGDTQLLYREVCGLLFFRYGITPTANKLYQLVRKGSMSAPAQALNRFWLELREKSRTRIEHPDLPEALRDSAGAAMAALWQQARQLAGQELDVFREEAAEQVRQAQHARELAEAERAASESALSDCQWQLGEAQQAQREHEQQLATRNAELAAASQALQAAASREAQLENELTLRQERFYSELEKMRDALRLADERLAAAERHALLEIDVARSKAAQLEKALNMARNQHQQEARRASEALQAAEQAQQQLREELARINERLTLKEDALALSEAALLIERRAAIEASARLGAAEERSQHWQDEWRACRLELAEARSQPDNRESPASS